MNLRDWRISKNLTMAEAAKLLDITQPTVSRIESGQQLPGPSTIAKLHARSGGAITADALFRAWQAIQDSGAAA